jgi:hypothetical protein
VRFSSCGKIAYIPAREAEDEAERMQEEHPYAHAYECPARSAKGTAHWHTTSGRTRWERLRQS